MTEKRDLLKDLEICEGATEGPWYARATDDDHYMNARYVGLDAGPGFVHDGVCGMGGDNKSERVIAITLLQAPDLACVQDERWDENATFIAEARLGWPHAITRALAAEARVKELEGLLGEAQTQLSWDDLDDIGREYIRDLSRRINQILKRGGQ